MIREHLLLVSLTSSLLLPPFAGVSANDAPVVVAAKTTAATGTLDVVYQPPLRGAPSTRVGGGTRGAPSQTLLSVVAPDHVGLTTEVQPTLYWFVGTPVGQTVELTIIDDDAIQPLLEIELQPPTAAGIHALRLDDAGVKLDTGKEYQWFVAIVQDPTRRSSDIVAGGAIKHVEPSAELTRQLAQTPREQWGLVYAKEGFWYDAIGWVSRQIETGSSAPRRQRAALLEQVGLVDAASYESKSTH